MLSFCDSIWGESCRTDTSVGAAYKGGVLDEGMVALVPAVALQSVLEKLGVSQVDLYKADCEGCEWSTFLSPEWPLHDRVRELAGELHVPCPNRSVSESRRLHPGRVAEVQCLGAQTLWVHEFASKSELIEGLADRYPLSFSQGLFHFLER